MSAPASGVMRQPDARGCPEVRTASAWCGLLTKPGTGQEAPVPRFNEPACHYRIQQVSRPGVHVQARPDRLVPRGGPILLQRFERPASARSVGLRRCAWSVRLYRNRPYHAGGASPATRPRIRSRLTADLPRSPPDVRRASPAMRTPRCWGAMRAVVLDRFAWGSVSSYAATRCVSPNLAKHTPYTPGAAAL